jgi:hypothetical protein
VTQPTLSPLGRRLAPSLADFLFIGLLFTRIHPTLFYDGDTAWHLWAGRWFLAHGPGAIADPLSFTRVGELWHSPQWLGEVLLALAYGHGAYMGVAILCSVVFAATFAWLYRILVRETEHPPAAIVVTILVAQVSLTQFLARPMIFTLPLFLGVWELALRPGRERATLLWAPLLTALWANVHPSAFLAPGLLGFAWWTRRNRLLAAATGLSLAALAATPWGAGWLRDLVPTGQNLGFFLRIDEWRTPGFREPKFWGLLLFILVSLAARRGSRRLQTSEMTWGLGWLGVTLLSSRMAPYAALAWALPLSRDLGVEERFASLGPLKRAWRGLRDGLAPFEAQLVPGLWPAVVGVAALLAAPFLAPAYPAVARGFAPDRFPARALQEADRLRLGPKVLNGYLWGGYVSWMAPGRYRVFIDGRAGFFGDQVLGDYLTVMELRPGWREVLDRRQPDWILVPPETPLANAAPLTGEWKEVSRDSTAVVLSRLP